MNSAFQRIGNHPQLSSQPTVFSHKSITRSSHPDDCSIISSYNNPNSWNFNLLKLKVLSLNCCSLRSSGKRALFQSLVDEKSPDCICGCESQLDGTYYNDKIFPSTCTTFRKDWVEGAGRVFLCIKKA